MHIAFLSIFPNTVGATVVIPKKHYSSYAFAQDDAPLAELVIASKKIARILDDTLEDVGRTAMVFEGYGVDHLHAKLFPMHGTGNHSEFKKSHQILISFSTGTRDIFLHMIGDVQMMSS